MIDLIRSDLIRPITSVHMANGSKGTLANGGVQK